MVGSFGNLIRQFTLSLFNVTLIKNCFVVFQSQVAPRLQQGSVIPSGPDSPREERSGREDRGNREDRGDRGTREDRGDRGTRDDRGDRGTREDRGDRGPREDMVDREAREERGGREDRGDRGGRRDRMGADLTGSGAGRSGAGGSKRYSSIRQRPMPEVYQPHQMQYITGNARFIFILIANLI